MNVFKSFTEINRIRSTIKIRKNHKTDAIDYKKYELEHMKRNCFEEVSKLMIPKYNKELDYYELEIYCCTSEQLLSILLEFNALQEYEKIRIIEFLKGK